MIIFDKKLEKDIYKQYKDFIEKIIKKAIKLDFGPSRPLGMIRIKDLYCFE